MPSPDILDFAALIAPIPGDDPAGKWSEGDWVTARGMLNHYRDPERFPSLPGGPVERQQGKRDPNWSKVIQETKSLLATKCKHIFYAVRLAEALVVQEGMVGVRDGLKLLRLMVTDCWDRSYWKFTKEKDEYGQPDPDYLKINAPLRIGEINALGHPLSPPMYPTKILKAPLFGTVCLQDKNDGKVDYEAAVATTPVEKIVLLIEDIELADKELRELVAACEPHVTKDCDPIELREVAHTIEECLTFARQALETKGGPPAAIDPAAPVAEGAPAKTGAAAIPNVDPTAQRIAIYEEINRLADKLEKIDSHSPVPWLLRRVKSLETMKFHTLVELLSAKDSVLNFLNPDKDKEKD